MQFSRNGTLQTGLIARTLGKKYPDLSRSHKKTADFVLANTFRAATMTIDELAAAAGISLATANRFAHALGFDGYAPFRAALVADFASSLAPVENLRIEVQKAATSAQIMAAAMDHDMRNLEATRRLLVPEHCDMAVDLILNADRIFVVGFGSSAYLAGIMAHSLEPYCRTVMSTVTIGGPSQTGRQFAKLDRRDVVIALAYPRYVTDTVRLAQRAVEKGAPLIAFTDLPTSPLAPLADVTIYAQTERRLSPTSDAAALMVIQAMCDAVAHRAKHSVQAASTMTEFVLPWLYRPENETHVNKKPVKKTAKKTTDRHTEA
jgi:DNA-binding MurR/RpiR family transcriptional regulator